jgi:hypothetical protein
LGGAIASSLCEAQDSSTLDSSPQPGATVTTDQSDYAPGTTVTISGSGFQSGENVTLTVLHSDGTDDNNTSPAHRPWTVSAGADGSFVTSWVVPADEDEVGARLMLTATGQSSGLTALAGFTDSFPTSLRVGYYEMCNNQGVSTEVPPIMAASETPVLVTDPSAANLRTIKVLFVDNCDNSGYGAGYLSRLSDIAAAVNSGMVLIIHDRCVSGANGILPGGSSFNIVRDFTDSSNIDVRDNTTLVTSGPGGTINNSTLDGGCSSSHGYAIASSLPANASLILSQGNPNHIVTFAYRYGAGFVIYSTIPLDFYLAGGSCGNFPGAFANIYAPNVVAYGASLSPANQPPVANSIPDQSGTYGSPFSYTFQANTFTDPDAGQTLSYTASGMPPGISFAGSTRTFSGTPIAAGTYHVTVTAIDDGTPPLSASTTFNFNVSPALLTIAADHKTKMYGASMPTLTVTATGFVNGDTLGSLTGTLGFSTVALASSSVGTYSILPGGLSSPNYTITFSAGTLSITPAGLTITADNHVKTYGAGLPTLTVSYSGFVNGDTPASLTTQPSVTTTATASSPVGSYPITPSGAVDANYTISYAPGTLTVTPAALMITANDHSKLYGAALPALTVSYSGLVNGDTPASLTTQPTVTTTATANSPVGNYPITASGAVDANYTISYAPGTLAVTPATLTITANDHSKLYGAALPSLTVSYSGLVNGDSPASLTTQPTVTTTATANSPVGNYPITASGAVDANYTISYAPGTLAVTPATLTITANDQSKLYGAALPALTVSYSGLVNGDSPASLTTQPSVTTTATASSPVGSYPITPSGAVDANYTISYAPGTLTVTPAALTITSNDQSKVYGAALPALTVSYGGLVNGDTPASLTTQPTVTTTATANSPVGSYPITVSGAIDANYTISYTPGTLTVTPAALTITANDQSKLYGAALPALTVSYSGLVNGDTPANLTTQPSVTTTATAGSPVGSYPITANGAVDANYTISYMPGTLKVTPSALTITADGKSKAYGAPLPALTVSYNGFVNGDTPANLTALPIVTTVASSASAVGTYPITASGAVDANYTINYLPGPITVTPVALVITANNQSKAYGAPLPVLTVSYSGFVNGDTTASLTTLPIVTTAATAASSVGTYPISAGGAADANYSISYVPGILTVTPVALTITADNNAKQYSDPLPVFTVSYNGLVNGDTPASLLGSLIVSTPATMLSGPGTYPITPSGLSSPNYSITWFKGTLTVTPEDAGASYTGALFVGANSSGSATLTLSATIQDITAVPSSPAYDPYPGDISKATVTFVNRDNNTTIATVPVGLVNSSDSKTGTATYNWSVNLGTADSIQFTIGIIINGYYTRNASADDTVVTVSKVSTGSVNGGGYLVLANSSGLKAGDAGSRNNFGFNVKNSSNGPKGSINTIIRRTESDGLLHVYQVKGTAMTSLVTQPNSTGGTATFNGKANIQDITNPLAPVSVDGNATLQVLMTDLGEPGSNDSIAITVFNKSGGTWFSSSWNGTQTVQQLLGGGNLVVR